MVNIWTSPEVAAALHTLAATGLFGVNSNDVAEQLLREKVREMVLQGWLKR